jgi:predicted dienelactone hydrolase
MKHTISIGIAVFILILSACSAPNVSPTSIPSVTIPTIIPSTIPEATMTQEPVILPLSEPGPYHVGLRRNITFEDSSRNGRKVTITIWYPATPPQGSTGSDPIPDATPEPSGGPYPLLLSSTKVGFIFAPHLASYGFVVAGINGQDSKDHWGQWLTDYPLDIVFALTQIAVNPPEGLVGVIDTEHAGAIGYSFDGYTSLALSGARVDPEFHLAQCAKAAAMNPTPPSWWVDYICNLTGGWDAFVTNAGSTITTSNEGLWMPMTDERIRAVMPMAPEGAWLFGERGLEAVDRPTLIVGATQDDINIYDLEAAYIFDHIRTPNQVMVSFIGQGHMMVYDPKQVARMAHFAVAFFGYHLQGQKDYAKYFSEDFVAQYEDLVWGVYQK